MRRTADASAFIVRDDPLVDESTLSVSSSSCRALCFSSRSITLSSRSFTLSVASDGARARCLDDADDDCRGRSSDTPSVESLRSRRREGFGLSWRRETECRMPRLRPGSLGIRLNAPSSDFGSWMCIRRLALRELFDSASFASYCSCSFMTSFRLSASVLPFLNRK